MWKLEEPLDGKSGKLSIGGLSCSYLASRYGTPLYVTDEDRVRQNYRRFTDAFSKHWKRFRAYYALKANSNLAIMSILRQEGAGADCSSITELQLASMAKFAVKDMLYTGAYNSDEELRFASHMGVTINIDDIGILERLAKHRMPETISFRINPGFGKAEFDRILCAGPNSKFGVDEKNASKAYARAKKLGARRFGIHMMAGSSVLDEDYFGKVTDKLFQIAEDVTKKTGVEFDFVDIGGGFGVPYRPDQEELDIARVGAAVAKRFKARFESSGTQPYLIAEPGRYLVCDSTILLTRVHAVKTTGRTFVGVDAGMHTLLRPALLDAYHHVLAADKLDVRPSKRVTIVGPICENGDIIAKDRLMPPLREGDLLAVLNAGAYGYSMSSNYNARPRAAEVLVKDGEDFLIREREDVTDVMDRQRIPGRLLR